MCCLRVDLGGRHRVAVRLPALALWRSRACSWLSGAPSAMSGAPQKRDVTRSGEVGGAPSPERRRPFGFRGSLGSVRAGLPDVSDGCFFRLGGAAQISVGFWSVRCFLARALVLLSTFPHSLALRWRKHPRMTLPRRRRHPRRRRRHAAQGPGACFYGFCIFF